LIEKYSETADQPKRSQHIQRIKSSVAHLTEILEEFLSVGKLEAGKVEVRPDEFNVPEFLSDLVTELDGMRRPGQQISTVIDESLSDFVSDTSMLRKVLLNGLSNALKFSQKEVFLKARMQDEELFIEIVDQGIGISEADQKHLFERFFRGGNANVIPGTGLGLHLMDRYMRLLGGELKLRSELGLGTTLTLTLPRLNYVN
jgi:signal transduction histidine kinase